MSLPKITLCRCSGATVCLIHTSLRLDLKERSTLSGAKFKGPLSLSVSIEALHY